MSSHIDSEKVKKIIGDALRNIQTEADPHILNEYRSIIKKEVSFFRRSYLCAYLLMSKDTGGRGKFEQEPRGNRGRKPFRPKVSAEEGPRSESPRYPLADEDSVRLFVSAGRSRRVFPREILGLINTKTAIPKEDIGAIRILDNYSFVQVRSTVADRIIEALNGCSFRGRTLSVNYARNRKEDGTSAFPDEPSPREEFSPAAEEAETGFDEAAPEAMVSTETTEAAETGFDETPAETAETGFDEAVPEAMVSTEAAVAVELSAPEPREEFSEDPLEQEDDDNADKEGV
jgi:hypothetical protein